MAEGHFNWMLMVIVDIAVIIGSQFGGTFMSQKAKPRWVSREIPHSCAVSVDVQLISQSCNLDRTFFVYASEWIESKRELRISVFVHAIVTIEIERGET